MKDELQKKLFDSYPDIFWQKDYPPSETNMCFGIETGDGWFYLIDGLCRAIKHHYDAQIADAIYHHENNKFSNIFYGWKHRWLKLWWWKLVLKNYKMYLARKEEPNPHDFKVTATQVKEKFGGLRFYTSGHDDIVDGMIRLAEELSYTICEVCGHYGKLSHCGTWQKTLCSDCAEKFRYDQEEDNYEEGEENPEAKKLST